MVDKNVVRRNLFRIACSSSRIMKCLLRVDQRSRPAGLVVLRFGEVGNRGAMKLMTSLFKQVGINA
jgi:hypothetical protein